LSTKERKYKANPPDYIAVKIKVVDRRQSQDNICLEKYWPHFCCTIFGYPPSQFRMQRQEKLAAQGKDSHSAYATTLQGQEIKPKEKLEGKEESPKALTPCLCGETHTWRKCPYICANKRPTGWQMAMEIKRKVKEAIEKLRTWNKEQIRKIQEESKGPTPGDISAFAVAFLTDHPHTTTADRPHTMTADHPHTTTADRLHTMTADHPHTTTADRLHTTAADHSHTTAADRSHTMPTDRSSPIQPASFSTAPPYQLQNSVILDLGATTHVFNAAHWFEGNIEPTNSACYAGKGVESITGFGTAKISLESSNGVHYAMLSDSTYIPGFNVNIVSLRKLNAKGVFWTTNETSYTA
jgi:hypothetical protein